MKLSDIRGTVTMSTELTLEVEGLNSGRGGQ